MYTVNDLKKAVDAQVARGNGSKKVLISGDEEGNYFNPLFYLFTSDPEQVKECIECSNSGFGSDDDPAHYVILG